MHAILATRYPGVQVGLPNGVPPVAGGVRPPDGVAFGRSDVLAVHPAGTTSSGTIYLCGAGGRCSAVRALGSTGRVTVWGIAATGSGWRER